MTKIDILHDCNNIIIDWAIEGKNFKGNGHEDIIYLCDISTITQENDLKKYSFINEAVEKEIRDLFSK